MNGSVYLYLGDSSLTQGSLEDLRRQVCTQAIDSFSTAGESCFSSCGLVARLEDADLEHFTEFFLGMVSNDGLRCAEVIRRPRASSIARHPSRASKR